jgi:CRISPR/Cas system-associated exonuclease Cas4 (RecB family)
MVEEPVRFEVNGIPYSGTIDLVDDKRRVRDWKTASRKPATGTSHLLQMTGYALAYRQRTGLTESEIVLDYLIRTKEPQYLPIASGGPIDGGTIVKFAKVIEDVVAQVEAGRFLPNGLTNNACSWCGYTNICPYFKEYRT